MLPSRLGGWCIKARRIIAICGPLAGESSEHFQKEPMPGPSAFEAPDVIWRILQVPRQQVKKTAACPSNVTGIPERLRFLSHGACLAPAQFTGVTTKSRYSRPIEFRERITGKYRPEKEIVIADETILLVETS